MSEIIKPVTATFDLGNIDAKQRFDVWRDSISVIFDVQLKPNVATDSFNASVTSSHLSSLVLCTARSQEQFFNRPPRRIAQDDLDHFLLQVYLRGSTTGQWGKKRNSTAQTGDILLLDLSQPVTSLASDFISISLVIPRYILEQYIPEVEKYHGCILPRASAFARLLSTHLVTLHEASSTLDANEVHTIAKGVAHLAGTYFGQTALSKSDPQVHVTTRATVQRYINNNLNNPNLTPNSIAAHFKMSRAYLYRLFDSGQGVSEYIQSQRLQRAFRELSRSNNHQLRIGEYAFSLGFNSESHFSRSFQRQFGVSPSDVRHTAVEQQQHNDLQVLLDRRYVDWIRKL